ncbi:RNA helicase [Candidatus Marinamargulisbacteria bacterium SCGC AAA071-K20]|nr:RNA helicase [Candidatus Marinamargulisbacteria bacterium SCGC AAA071-K20]
MENEKKTFKDLGLSEILLKALEKKGFEEPSQIQAETIPVMLTDERDIIGQAQTGTGKTAAFGLPILEKLTPTTDHIQALILTPTRELTIQVSDELHSLKGEKPLRITPVYGGQSIEKQIKQLRKPNDIIVGTPGRLIDHLNRKRIDLSHVKYLVLDEADEMLKTGFLEDIEIILGQTNKDRKTLLFSATMPSLIQRLAQNYMKEYVTIAAKKATLATSLTEQIYFEVRESDKLEALCRIIDVEDDFYGLIFCRTKRDVDSITERLVHRGYEAEAMHGDLSQHQRERVLGKFRKKICSVLVVTDVASRGLDINGLSHVINFALPQDAESYVHRVGRTGRAGKTGNAITFITPSEYRKLTYIQKVAKTEIKKAEVPDVQTIIKTKKNRIQETLLKAIGETIENDYLDFAEALLETHNPKEALAGVLKVAFESEFSEKSYTEIRKAGRSDGRDRGRDGGRDRDRGRGRDRDRGERDYGRGRDRDRGFGGDRREFGNRNSSRGGDNPKSFVDTKGQTRLFIAKGKMDKINPRELVDYIEKSSNVQGRNIQGVEIYDKFSFVNVPYGDADAIIQAFKTAGRDNRPMVERAK